MTRSTVGVCGHLWLDSRHRARVHAAATQALRASESLIETGAAVRLITGLAPGSDLVLTAAVSEWCEARNLDCEIEALIVCDADHLIEAWQERARQLGLSLSAGAQNAVRERMDYWLSRAAQVHELDVEYPGHSGFEALAAQIAQRSECLLAVRRDQHVGSSGGTGDVLRWRADPTLVPAALRTDVSVSRSRIVIDPDSGDYTRHDG